ncbi:MAG TPA: metal ABC transporter permease [Miltoncostaeales bacterium]|nr:metal ABC transporter permease [Miltoncostaeales bacterium]
MDLYGTFIDPLTPHHMQRALLEVLIMAVPAGLLGAWVVVRRLGFATHAMGHATFPALVIAALAGWSLLATTVAAALLIGALIAALHRRRELQSGAAVAVVLATSLALGAVLVSDVHDPGVSANGLLFGSIFGLTTEDLVASAVVAALAIGATLIGFRPFTVAAFDDDSRRQPGADIVQLMLIAVAVAVSARIIGSLLVAAMYLIPAATARQFTTRLSSLMIWGCIIAALDGVAGLWLSATADTPPGASIAACATAVFLIVATGRTVRLRFMRTIPT